VRSAGPGPRSVCRIRTSSGRWLAVHGNRVSSYPADVAVVLAPASLGQLLPAVIAWAGLTPRESQVLDLAARELPSQRVATARGLSLLTVHTHLRSIYRKSGVSSRDELVGRLT